LKDENNLKREPKSDKAEGEYFSAVQVVKMTPFCVELSFPAMKQETLSFMLCLRMKIMYGVKQCLNREDLYTEA
jgi:hypothetical protein